MGKKSAKEPAYVMFKEGVFVRALHKPGSPNQGSDPLLVVREFWKGLVYLDGYPLEQGYPPDLFRRVYPISRKALHVWRDKNVRSLAFISSEMPERKWFACAALRGSGYTAYGSSQEKALLALRKKMGVRG